MSALAVNPIVWAVAGIVLLVGVAALRSRAELRAWLGADPIVARRWLRALCLIAVAVLVGRALQIAATRPPQLTGSGADVVILVDVSRSMDARDTAPSRLRRAVRTAEHVVEEASGVRLGLVLFAGEAFVALPLTQDRDALLTYVRALDSDTVSVRGSDMERGLEVAARTFDPRSNRPRTLLLLSDGEHAGSGVDGMLSRLKSQGIRAVVVGYGRETGDVVPLAGGGNLEDGSGVLVRSRRDDALLRRIASVTGGVYFREWEERPTPAHLLPPPEPDRPLEPPPQDDPLRPLLLAAAVLLAWELFFSSRARRPGLRRRARRLPAAARAGVTALLALALIGFGPTDWLYDGDEILEERPQDALSLYRRTERTRGPTPASRIRVGNAQYRLGRMDQAASAYLDALRLVDSDDVAARYSASFNLGNTLLGRERYREAYDAYWTALLARPESLEAKFNYEWAAQRVEPEPPVPDLPSPQQSQDEGESDSEEAAASGQGSADAPVQRGGLSQSDAERWMQSIEETVSDALQRQITKEYDGQPQGRRRGQTW